MRKSIVVAGMLWAVLGAAAYADDDDWAGLYEGLDPRSGSTDHLSLVPSGNGAFDVILVTDRFSLCDQTPGWFTGSATEVDGHLEVEIGERACSNGSEPEQATAPGPRIDLIEDDEIVKVTPKVSGGIPLHYHRISDK
ncbi:MAG: hypothetical protein GY798_22970 [Hyphomicrobiales bacterium]|nr:hypothetical protein [Hyphomicrobiales bacterium]